MSQQLHGEERNRGRPALAERVEPCSGPTGRCAVFVNPGAGQLPFTRLVWGSGEEQEPDGSERSGEEAKGTGAGPVNYPFLEVWLRKRTEDQARPRKDKVTNPQRLALPLWARFK